MIVLAVWMASRGTSRGDRWGLARHGDLMWDLVRPLGPWALEKVQQRLGGSRGGIFGGEVRRSRGDVLGHGRQGGGHGRQGCGGKSLEPSRRPPWRLHAWIPEVGGSSEV